MTPHQSALRLTAVSLRLGHAAALTCHRHVIHSRGAASLPQGEAFTGDTSSGCFAATYTPSCQPAFAPVSRENRDTSSIPPRCNLTGLPRQTSEAFVVGRGDTTKRMRRGACAAAKNAKSVSTRRRFGEIPSRGRLLEAKASQNLRLQTQRYPIIFLTTCASEKYPAVRQCASVSRKRVHAAD